MRAIFLLVASLLALQPLAATGADAARCDALEELDEAQVAAQCNLARFEEEEDEDQALLQTAGAKLLNPGKPTGPLGDRPTLERRSTSGAAAQVGGAAPSVEDEALLQLPGKALARPRAGSAAEAPEPTKAQPAEAQPPPAQHGAVGLRPADPAPREVPPALYAEPAVDLATLWTGPHYGYTWLKALSLVALAATGLVLRQRRLAQEREEELPLKLQVEELAEAAKKKPGKEVAKVEEEGESKAKEEEEALPALPELTTVGTSYAVPITRIARCQEPMLSVEVPVSPSVWPLHATFSRIPGEAAWSKVDLTVDVIDAAGLPPLLTCSLPGAAARLRSSEDTGGTGATGDATGDDAEPGACAADQEACLEIHRGNGTLAAWIVKEETDGHFSVKRPSHAGWDVRVYRQPGDCRMVVTKKSQVICAASMLSEGRENRKTWAGEEAMEGEVKLVQIQTQPDTSSPESILLLMCMMSLVVFQP